MQVLLEEASWGRVVRIEKTSKEKYICICSKTNTQKHQYRSTKLIFLLCEYIHLK